MAMTMEQLQQPLFFKVDVKEGLVQRPLRTRLMKGDKKANRIVVLVKDGSEKIDLSGIPVSGSFIKPPDDDEIYLPGSVEDGMAVVELDDACYVEDGHFEASVALVMDGFKRTIVSFSGEVLSKGNGVVIDIGNVIPSIEEIAAQYAEMKRVTEETRQAAGDANEAAGRAPYIDEATGTWFVWDNAKGAYADTGSVAKGAEGDPGKTPHIGENGNWWIGETDTGTPATGPEGKQGPKGDQGDGLKILGLYATLAALQAAHPMGSAGDAYAVGTESENEIYIWDADAGTWTSLGALQGPEGPQGPQGDSVELDTTLKEAGRAADAKATGDALSELKDEMVTLPEGEEAPGTAPEINAGTFGGMTVAQFVDMIYPVGSIYMSVRSTSPATLFGGTWKQIMGRFLIGTGAPELNDDGTSPGSYNYAAGAKGGEATHKLTVSEMPSHNHAYSGSGDNTDYTWAAPNLRLRYIYTEENPYPGILTSSYEGGGQPHNNLPPYLAVYMWQRTA